MSLRRPHFQILETERLFGSVCPHPSFGGPLPGKLFRVDSSFFLSTPSPVRSYRVAHPPPFSPSVRGGGQLHHNLGLSCQRPCPRSPGIETVLNRFQSGRSSGGALSHTTTPVPCHSQPIHGATYRNSRGITITGGGSNLRVYPPCELICWKGAFPRPAFRRRSAFFQRTSLGLGPGRPLARGQRTRRCTSQPPENG
jgi:hypothetical protein